MVSDLDLTISRLRQFVRRNNSSSFLKGSLLSRVSVEVPNLFSLATGSAGKSFYTTSCSHNRLSSHDQYLGLNWSSIFSRVFPISIKGGKGSILDCSI